MCNCKMCGWLKGLFGKKNCCEEKGCCEEKKEDVVAPVAPVTPVAPVKEDEKKEETAV